MNIADLQNVTPVPPDEEQARAPSSGISNIAQLGPIQTEDEFNESQYGTPGQQAMAGLEGVGQGALGSISTAVERAVGVNPEGIRKRAEVNPITHGLGQAAGFAGSLLTGEGIAPAVTAIGEGATKLAGLGEAASTISKIASSGIRTGAEMAALQAGDEVSKLITQDPNQSLQTAAINVGLSGVIGGAGGAVLGAVSPLWKASMEKVGAPKIIDDAKAQYDFRQNLPNGDVPGAITNEVATRLQEVKSIDQSFGNLKGAALEPAMPEVSPGNTAKIDEQLNQISSSMTNAIDKASDNAYLKGGVPKLVQDFQDFLGVATDPSASYADKFDATNQLKRALDAKANYRLNAEDTALGSYAKKLANEIRPMLEDSKVWGEAGNVQKESNAAYSSFSRAQADAEKRLGTLSHVENGYVADPAKINTLVNQSLKGKAGLKTDFIRAYIDQSQKLADTLNKIHVEAGLEAPVRLTPTPALDHTLGRSSPGTTLGNWLYDKGLATVAGDVTGGAVGAGLGSLIGHPAFGAFAGERLLAPTFTSLAKPLLENASNAAAFKASIDYVASVVKGGRVLSQSVENLFKGGAEVIPREIIPNQASRDKLEKSLNYASSPETALNIGGHLGHYLPNHSTAAASTAATASNVLHGFKPTQVQRSPLDKPAPITKMDQASYARALDIAQQPLMALHYAKQGTLQQKDVQVLNSIYPSLHNQMIQKITDSMTKSLAEGTPIPYKTRLGLSKLLGQPLDSTMVAPSMQAVMMANAPKTPPQAQGQKKVSKSTASSQQKVAGMYATPQQARLSEKGKS